MSHNETLFGVAEYQLDLLPRYSGEPFQKIVNSGAPFKVFEQGAHGDSAMLE